MTSNPEIPARPSSKGESVGGQEKKWCVYLAVALIKAGRDHIGREVEKIKCFYREPKPPWPLRYRGTSLMKTPPPLHHLTSLGMVPL